MLGFFTKEARIHLWTGLHRPNTKGPQFSVILHVVFSFAQNHHKALHTNACMRDNHMFPGAHLMGCFWTVDMARQVQSGTGKSIHMVTRSAAERSWAICVPWQMSATRLSSHPKVLLREEPVALSTCWTETGVGGRGRSACKPQGTHPWFSFAHKTQFWR